MKISYNLVSLIDILGLVQAVLLGILLIYGSKGRKALFFLGIMLISFGLELTNAILQELNITQQALWLLFLPFDFHYLTLPAFYLYAKSLTQPVSIKLHWKVLAPGIVEFVFLTFLFFLPPNQKVKLLENEQFGLYYDSFRHFSLVFSIFYAVLTIRLVNKHQHKVQHYFSETTSKMLTWVKVVAVFLIIYMLMWIVVSTVPSLSESNNVYIFMSAINVVFIFWLALVGIKQAMVYIPDDILSETEGSETDQNHVENKIENDQRFEEIRNHIETEKPYKNPRLSLADIADQLNIPQRTVSMLINEYAKTNFSQFINQYRVEEAKTLINNPKYRHLNMLGIAFEVGFNSKTSFFTTFKKITGTTPTNFHKV